MGGTDISSRVEIRVNSKFGRVLYALLDVAPGEEVFVEKPILLTFSETTSQEEMLLRRVSEKSGMNLVADFVWVKSFCQANEEARVLVLDCYSPPANEIQHSVLLTGLMRVVDIAKTYKWSANFDKDTLCKVVLIKACNAHGYFSQSSTAAALYTYGSKLRHSCLPNVVYTSQRSLDGQGSFVARKPVKSGDELFISYISIFQSTPMRNVELMENYLFTCECSLCTKGVDKFRGRRCSCGSGTQYFDQSLHKWSPCDLCGLRPKGNAEFLREEQNLVLDGEEFLRSFHANIPAALGRKFAELSQSILGPNHAISKKIEKVWVEKNMHIMDTNELEVRVEEIIRWCSTGWVDFFDSSLVEIACILGRAGKFHLALKYLTAVLEDMNLLFGKNSEVEQKKIVQRAINACMQKKIEKIPQIQSEQGCPMQ